MIDLKTTYLGLQLKNPIIVGSSGLTDDVEKIVNLEAHGAAAVVLKSLFEEEILLEMEENIYRMTNRNFIFPEAIDYAESIVKDDLLSDYLELIRETKKVVQIPVIASINCVTANRWTTFAHEIEKAGADALELNFFFLPTDNKRGEKEILEVTYEILSKVKGSIRIPVSVKISPYQTNLMRYVKQIDEAGVEGVVLFNRSWSPDIDLQNMVVSSAPALSNPTDVGNTLRWVSLLSGKINANIAASTGIHDGAALIKQLLAGAEVVQVVSTLYLHDVYQIQTMLDDLTRWMELNEFTSLNQFRGRLNYSHAGNPAAWERVQFMRQFRSFV